MHPLLTYFLGGFSILLFGFYTTARALESLTTIRLAGILKKSTAKPYQAFLIGILFGFFMQSGSATTALLLGFVSAGLLDLTKALYVVSGAAVGATFMLQIVAFKITDYAFLLIFLGVILLVLIPSPKLKLIGQVLVGFGLVFYGLHLLLEAGNIIQGSPELLALVRSSAQNSFLALIFSTFLTALIQNGSAFIALVMSLTAGGVFSAPMAIPFVLGANLGGTALSLFSSLSASREAKRLALGYFFLKLGGVTIFMLLLNPFSELILLTTSDPSRQVVNAHSLFNLLTAFIFWFLLDYLTLLLEKIVPLKKEELKPFYLQTTTTVPAVGFELARREILRMADIIEKDLLIRLFPLLKEGKEEDWNDIMEKEKLIDYLYRTISSYLANLKSDNPHEAEEGVKLLYVANDLEHLGDIMVAISEIGKKLKQNGIDFSPEGWQDLEKMYKIVAEELKAAIKAFAEDDAEMAMTVLQHQAEVERLEKELRYAHFRRIQYDNPQSLESSAYHLDLVNNFLRVNEHSVNIAQTVLGII